ncbi:MAG: hypothetical protein WA130_18830 [Candidatus Methanoperedens sp.]
MTYKSKVHILTFGGSDSFDREGTIVKYHWQTGKAIQAGYGSTLRLRINTGFT